MGNLVDGGSPKRSDSPDQDNTMMIVPQSSWNSADDALYLSEKRARVMSEHQFTNNPEEVPKLIDMEPEVAQLEKFECKICRVYVGDRICLPCGHFPICSKCMNERIHHAVFWNRSIQCPAPSCYRRVVEYPRFQYATHQNQSGPVTSH